MALSDLLVKVGIDSSGFRSGISELRSQSASLRASMAQMAGTIRDQVKELNAMARAGKTGTDEFKKLEQQIKGNEAAFKGMTKEARYLDKQLQQMEGPKMGGMMKDIGGALTGGIIGGGVAGAVTAGIQQLQQTFNETLKVAADFDDQLRKISATSGATSEEMAMLRDTAIEWGAKSAFSASESAQAMQYMAQAGWSAQQSMAGLPGVLNLAASSGEDLAMTASIVTDGLTAFKLEASDSARFADVLAAAAAASNTNVGKMGDTFRYVGPVAGALGFTIEDTALAIGLMANSGIKGEQAGTALRAMFTRLADPTKESKMAMEALGISLTDNQGRTKSLSLLINELRAAFAGLTPAQQAQRAAQLAGTEAMSGALALITASEQSVNALSEAIGNSNGKAQEMADIMEGGVGGSLRKMQGAWESLQLTITGSGSFAQVWYDGWATVFDKWAQDLQGIKKDYHEFRRILQIGLFDALKESEQTKGIEAFGKDYKKALEGFPMSKLTDQMTRLTNTAEFQAAAFDKRNAAVMAKLAPRTDLAEAIKAGKAGKELDEAAKAAGRFSESLDKIKAPQVSVVSNLMGADQSAMFDLTDKMRKQLEEANILQGIFGNINLIDEEIKALGDVIKGGIESAIDPTILQPFIDRLKELEKMKLGPQINVDEQSLQMGNMMADMAKKISEDRKLAEAFGMQFDSMGVEANALAEFIRQGIETNMSEELLRPVIDRWSELNAEINKQGFAVGIIEQVGSVAMSTFEAIGAGSTSAAQGFAAVGKAALMASLDFLKGKLLESTGGLMKWASSLGPFGIPIATAGVGALFALVKGAIGRTKGVQLAEGGIISGRTMAEVGEYPGAAFNPEVVAPLDKLQAMLDIGGSTHVTGTFRVQGADLVLAMDNAQRKMSQFRV